MPNTYLNLAAYQFADLDDLPGLRAHLLAEGRRLDMRGTILLTPEGVNIMLSGPTDNARAFADVLRSLPPLANMHIKESLSDEQSFNRFLVKIKRETITFRQPGIRPADGRAATVSPEHRQVHRTARRPGGPPPAAGRQAHRHLLHRWHPLREGSPLDGRQRLRPCRPA